MNQPNRTNRWPVAKLKERGWTEELLRQLLPPPQYRRYGTGRTRFWPEQTVLAAEQEPAFQAAQAARGAQAAAGVEAALSAAAQFLEAAWQAAQLPDTLPGQLAKILAALSSGNLPCDMIEFFTADRLSVMSGEDIEWTLDGERGEASRRFEIINQYKKVQLVLPQRATQTVPVVSETVPAVPEEPIVKIENETED